MSLCIQCELGDCGSKFDRSRGPLAARLVASTARRVAGGSLVGRERHDARSTRSASRAHSGSHRFVLYKNYFYLLSLFPSCRFCNVYSRCAAAVDLCNCGPRAATAADAVLVSASSHVLVERATGRRREQRVPHQ